MGGTMSLLGFFSFWILYCASNIGCVNAGQIRPRGGIGLANSLLEGSSSTKLTNFSKSQRRAARTANFQRGAAAVACSSRGRWGELAREGVLGDVEVLEVGVRADGDGDGANEVVVGEDEGAKDDSVEELGGDGAGEAIAAEFEAVEVDEEDKLGGVLAMEKPHASDSNEANAWAAGDDFVGDAGLVAGVGAEEGGHQWMVVKSRADDMAKFVTS